jgi:hypothetical protein
MGSVFFFFFFFSLYNCCHDFMIQMLWFRLLFSGLMLIFFSFHCRNLFGDISGTSKGRCGLLHTRTCKEIVQDQKLDCNASSSLTSFFSHRFFFLFFLVYAIFGFLIACFWNTLIGFCIVGKFEFDNIS